MVYFICYVTVPPDYAELHHIEVCVICTLWCVVCDVVCDVLQLGVTEPSDYAELLHIEVCVMCTV